jgi:hypothetical protein
MSLGYGSVRASDGICLKHDRYLSADSSCRSLKCAAARQRREFSLQAAAKQIHLPREHPRTNNLLIFQAFLSVRRTTFYLMFSGIWWSAVDDRSAA